MGTATKLYAFCTVHSKGVSSGNLFLPVESYEKPDKLLLFQAQNLVVKTDTI